MDSSINSVNSGESTVGKTTNTIRKSLKFFLKHGLPIFGAPLNSGAVEETATGESTSENEAVADLNQNQLVTDEIQLSNEEIKDLLMCPVCLEVTLPPIHSCRRGHIVCNSCQEATVICPLCEASYCYTRCFFAERVFEKISIHCRYQEDGCKQFIRGKDVAKHFRSCDYRPLRCVNCFGKWMKYGEYWEHLLKFHKISGIDKPYGFATLNLKDLSPAAPTTDEKCMFLPSYFKGFGETFLLRSVISEDFLCTYVSLVGPEIDSKKYTAKIILRIPELKVPCKEYAWNGPISNFRDCPLEICDGSGGLMMPFEILSSSWIQKIRFEVNITEAKNKFGNSKESENCRSDSSSEEVLFDEEIDFDNLNHKFWEELELMTGEEEEEEEENGNENEGQGEMDDNEENQYGETSMENSIHKTDDRFWEELELMELSEAEEEEEDERQEAMDNNNEEENM